MTRFHKYLPALLIWLAAPLPLWIMFLMMLFY